VEVKREEQEVNDLLNKCVDSEDEGVTKYPGMTFEQGIRAGIEWLTDGAANHPLED